MTSGLDGLRGRFQGIWGIREESHKTRNGVLSDELIYLAEPRAGNDKVAHVWAEKYLKGDAWFDLHLTLEIFNDRESHFNAIVDFPRISLPPSKSESHVERVGIHWNTSVFVEGPEFIQLPKGMVAKGIPSLIGLQRVEDVCYCGWEQAAPSDICGIPSLEDGKADGLFLGLGKSSPGKR